MSDWATVTENNLSNQWGNCRNTYKQNLTLNETNVTMGTCEHNRPILHGKDARQTLPNHWTPMRMIAKQTLQRTTLNVTLFFHWTKINRFLPGKIPAEKSSLSVRQQIQLQHQSTVFQKQWIFSDVLAGNSRNPTVWWTNSWRRQGNRVRKA